jgi:glycosyltransferase involved in cell wall biosynthesis
MHYYDFELCTALQAAGMDVTLLTCDETARLRVPEGLPVEFPFRRIYGESPRLLRGLRYGRALSTVAREMRRRAVPLGHFHFFHFLPLDYLFLKALRGIGKRVVITAHDVIPFDARPSDIPWLRRLYSEADRLIVHTQDSKNILVSTFDVPDERIRAIPHGPFLQFADEQAQPQTVARKHLEIDGDARVVLFWGQIKAVKGLEHLIRAFHRVAEQRPDALLVIAGPEWKESFDRYAALLREMGLTGRVVSRIEYVPDEEVGTYFSAADLVVLPYTESYQSGVLYMAYSFSKPVVASAVGGLAEVVEDGVTGMLVPPREPETLAEAVLHVLGGLDRAREMGKRGRELVETRFGWGSIARQTADVYAEALGCTQTEPSPRDIR